ncbi:MAG: MBL fold metallo-hydrolase [Leptolyngbya sp. SIO3F4]|nr:MBL fold metallo-hydrolase [Leptolyngbya sp. SIO3F4]
MIVEQIYTGCLAEAAYYIESEGEAAIIDPLRETAPYMDKAASRGAKIKYVLETHFHADFVSGHIDLAKKTGATIVFGPSAQPGYDALVAQDGEILQVGKVQIQVLHTPGHTMESTTYLLMDEDGKHHSIFTGDTLFIGDVGRPDLAVKTDLSQEDLAGHLYDSLYAKIMPLADEVIVYPGHGAGSACGKNMSSETFDTLGHQKQVNYALQPMDKDEFVRQVIDGLTPPPQYFPKNARMNKEGYDTFDKVLERGQQALEPDAFEELVNSQGALMLDVRGTSDFVRGHIPNAIFVGLDGSFASWVGTLVTDLKQPIVLIAPEGREEEAITRLSRVGYDHTLGYLKGGMDVWKASGKEMATVESIAPGEFAQRNQDQALTVIDVRKPGEWDTQHLAGSGVKNIPLDYINQHMDEFPKQDKLYLHCKGGYRSLVAASILKARGYHDLVNVEGGFDALLKEEVPVTESQCSTSIS